MTRVSDEDIGPLPSDLRGRRAVVTGAAHGIGRAIARRLLQAGAEVVALDRDEQALRRAFSGDDCEQLVADVSDPGFAATAELLADRGGPIELIVNNVGAATHRSFRQLDESSFDRVVRTNLRGPWFFTRRLVDALIASGRPGSLLFISSLHDTFVRLYPDYSATKAGVAMLAKELAYELAPHRIRVNVLSPGWVETADEGEPTIPQQNAVNLIPARRFGEPDDIARIAIVLLSDAWSSYVTGANIRVDGGLALHDWLMDV
jgi:NAD(P)-dependent dehydrogenase (short-subunit alcohol dehydrogenase family)